MSEVVARKLRALAQEYARGRLTLDAYRRLRGPMLDSLGVGGARRFVARGGLGDLLEGSELTGGGDGPMPGGGLMTDGAPTRGRALATSGGPVPGDGPRRHVERADLADLMGDSKLVGLSELVGDAGVEGRRSTGSDGRTGPDGRAGPASPEVLAGASRTDQSAQFAQAGASFAGARARLVWLAALAVGVVIVPVVAGWLVRDRIVGEPRGAREANVPAQAAPEGSDRIFRLVAPLLEDRNWTEARIAAVNAGLLEEGARQIAAKQGTEWFQRFAADVRRRLKERQDMGADRRAPEKSSLAALAVTIGLDPRAPDAPLRPPVHGDSQNARSGRY